MANCLAALIRVRVLKLAIRAVIVLPAVFLPFTAQALSLGEVEVQSKLNEPFAAQIPVASASAAEIGSLRVGLAGQQDWQRAGLSPQSTASKIRFGFVATGGGNLAITLRTDEPVREPLLVFLVDAAWGSGHLLREYNVFLDPESLPVAAPAPVAAPQVQAPAAYAPRQQTPSAPSYWGQRYGPVEAGQSLSKIAEALIAGTSLKRDQMVWALFQTNPHAFTADNINWLNVGANLSVPTQQEVAAIAPQRATQLVQQAASVASNAKSSVNEGASKNSVAAPVNQQAKSDASEAVASTSTASKAEEDASKSPSSTPSKAEAETATSSSVDKLELLPLENAEVEAAENALDQTATESNGSGRGTELEASNASEPTSAENKQRERELAAENILLRERISETEALLKEIRGLLAARSEQLSDLQQRLERVETTTKTATVTDVGTTSQPVGWFWWLLMILALLIIILLVLLLWTLTKRQNHIVNKEDLEGPLETDVVESSVPKADAFVAVAAPPVSSEDSEPVADQSAAVTDQNEAPYKPVNEHQANDNDAPVFSTAVPAAVSADTDDSVVVDEPEQEAPKPTENALGESRETVDDTPLEFDIGGYTEAQQAEPEAEFTAPEASEPEAFSVDDFDLPPLEELPDFDPVATSDESIDSGEVEFSTADPLVTNVEDDAEALLTDTDLLTENADEIISDTVLSDDALETIEIESGLLAAGAGLSDVDEPAPEIDSAMDVSDFSGGDQVATKLDLARVYADMGDAEEAQSILEEVLREGDETQKTEAQNIMDGLS